MLSPALTINKESEESDKRGGVAESSSSGSCGDKGSSSVGEFSSEEDDEGTSKKPAIFVPLQVCACVCV